MKSDAALSAVISAGAQVRAAPEPADDVISDVVERLLPALDEGIGADAAALLSRPMSLADRVAILRGAAKQIEKTKAGDSADRDALALAMQVLEDMASREVRQ